VKFVADEPVINVEIAHIRGEKLGAARYEEAMSSDERRAFANLMLMCVPHHKVIDRLHPDDYPVALLEQWKRDREGQAAATLTGITEDRLAELIEAAVRAVGVERRVDVELVPGIAMQKQTFTIPGPEPDGFFDLYRDIGIPALLIVARNPTLIDAVVSSHAVRLLPAGAAVIIPDTPYEALPATLPAGHSVTWAYPLSAFYLPVLGLRKTDHEVSSLRAEVTLATSEEWASAEIPLAPLGRLDRAPWNR
jgi:hypothetical protein